VKIGILIFLRKIEETIRNLFGQFKNEKKNWEEISQKMKKTRKKKCSKFLQTKKIEKTLKKISTFPLFLFFKNRLDPTKKIDCAQIV